jgi:hypothetical protein
LPDVDDFPEFLDGGAAQVESALRAAFQYAVSLETLQRVPDRLGTDAERRRKRAAAQAAARRT